MTLSLDVAPSNQCLAFGDEHCGISLFSTTGAQFLCCWFRHIYKPYFYIRELLYSRPLSSFPYILNHCHLWRLSSLHENFRIVKFLYFFSFQVTRSLPSTCIPGRPSSRAHCPPSPTWPSTTHTPSTGTHWYSWIFWHQATSTDVFSRLFVCVYHHFIWLQSKKRKDSNKYLSQKMHISYFPPKKTPTC